MVKIVICILASILIFPISAFAIERPTLLTPENTAVTNSSTLTWQETTDAVQYRVIVDDEAAIISPYIKNYYTTNTKYSPSLEPGIYFWKVSAKDGSGNWSVWSDIWSFTLTASSDPEPAPQASSQPQEEPDPTSAFQKSAFTISDTPTQISSDESFATKISLTLPNNPNSTFYLKGAFKKPDGSNYFGFTKVGSSWIKNGSSYSSQYQISTDSEGMWDGTLDVKPDQSDSGFIGTGDYIFKVGRYSSSGSGPSWSNEQTIHITGLAITQNASEETQTANKSSTSLNTSPNVKGISKSLIRPKDSSSSSQSSAFNNSSPSATAADNSSDSTNIQASRLFDYLPFLGGFFILLGAGSVVYIKLKNR